MPFRGKSFKGKVSGGACPPCPPGVTPYASIADLVTASQGSLAPGYYEVVGEWITYWDGAAFTPEYVFEQTPNAFDSYSAGFDFTDFDPDDDIAQAPNMFDDFELGLPFTLDHWWHRDALVDLGLLDNADVTLWPAGAGIDLMHDGISQLAKFRTADGGYLEITNGGSQLLDAAGIVNAQPTTIFIYTDLGGITGGSSSGSIYDGVSSRNHLFLNASDTNLSMFAGSIVNCGVPANVASKRLITSVYNGASSVAYVNKTKGSTISVGASGLNGFRLGANNSKANNGAQKTRFAGILFRVPTDAEVAELHDYCVATFG